MSNFIEDVALKLGLEIGQRFCIRHYRGHLLNDWQTEATLVFMFTKDKGLISINTENNMYQSNQYLADLILGRYTVAPYEAGCETPKKDKELFTIYDYLKNLKDDLTSYTKPQWLEMKEIYFNDASAKAQYEDLRRHIERIRDNTCDTMALPIFEMYKDKES